MALKSEGDQSCKVQKSYKSFEKDSMIPYLNEIDFESNLDDLRAKFN